MKLATRQQEALTHRAHGLSNAETAAVMHCSVNNVNNLLRECYFKLFARGAPDAIAKAMHQGLIHLCILMSLGMGCGLFNSDALRVQHRIRLSARTVRVGRNSKNGNA